MGWNLSASDLSGRLPWAEAGWHPAMLRYARDGGPQIDPDQASAAVFRALDIVREVVALGGTLAVASDDSTLSFLPTPVVYPGEVDPARFARLPDSPDRVQRLREWAPRWFANADAIITSASKRWPEGYEEPAPGLQEVPDLLFVVGSVVSRTGIDHAASRRGVPVIAAVAPEDDPHNVDLVIPGSFTYNELTDDLAAAIQDTLFEGRQLLADRLSEYGAIAFPDVERLREMSARTDLYARASAPHVGVDVDEVLAAWNG